jgi:hypothetical protein
VPHDSLRPRDSLSVEYSQMSTLSQPELTSQFAVRNPGTDETIAHPGACRFLQRECKPTAGRIVEDQSIPPLEFAGCFASFLLCSC